ncbi:MAG: transglutaminase-like domain-containing protein [Caloramator sp.]|nr:transglutaminase-like domain-containing protein [Caloramator sp.]
MKKKINSFEFIVYLIIITIATFCIVDITFKVASIKYNKAMVLTIIILVLVYYYILYSIKYSWISIILFFIIPKPLYLINMIKVIIFELKNFIYSLIENQYIIEGYADYFRHIIYFILPIFLLILFYIVVIKNWTIPIFLIGGSIFIIYYFISIIDLSASCSIYFLVSLALYSYNEYIKSEFRWKNSNTNIKPYYYIKIFAWVIVILFLVNILSKLLPYNSKVNSFDWIEGNVFDKFTKLRNSYSINSTKNITKKRFLFSYTGYQQDPQRLGGPIKIDNSVAMKIFIQKSTKELHLRGTVKDYYNGYMWNKTNYTLKKYTSSSLEGAKNRIDIYPVKTITTTAFNILPLSYVNNKWNYFYIDSDGEMYNPKKVNNGEIYSVYFDELENIKIQPDNINFPQSYDKELEKYLKLPDNIPKRVYDLTYNITKNYASPFYKAIALQNYLKENYPYDINVAYLPSNRDFVDYFLFDEKKGYCTYFASALAVMCRIVNIPTRYIEGFYVTGTNRISGNIDVLNSNAHAWVEVYFDKVGWITFDPTPGHFSINEFIEKNKLINDDIKQNIEKRRLNDGEINIIKNKIKNEIEKDEENISVKNKRKYNIYLNLIIFAFLLSVFFYYKNNRFYKKEKSQIINLSMKIIKYGKYVGIYYNKGETFREYSQRFGDKINFDMEEYVDLYEKIIYGNSIVNDEDLNKLIKLFEGIKICVKNNIGVVKFYIKDYINMLIFIRIKDNWH